MSLNLSWADWDLIDDLHLNTEFFRRNEDKADAWFQQAHKLNVLLREKNIAQVAPTGTGKTVVAFLASIIANTRTIVVVPNKALAYEHEKLLLAMKPGFTAQVITGTLPFMQRDWSDQDDRMFIATGETVRNEIKSGDLDLNDFDRVVFDEIHHATDNYVYTELIKIIDEHPKRIAMLDLTASLVNKLERLPDLWRNGRFDDVIKLDLPGHKVRTSVVYAEHADSIFHVNYARAEKVISEQMNDALAGLSQTSMQLPLGKELTFDPKKIFKRSDLVKLRDEINSFGQIQRLHVENRKTINRLSSNLAYYSAWAHIYDLFLSESFLAIRAYYMNRLDKNKGWYAKRIRRLGRIYLLTGLVEWVLHPKQEMVGRIIESATNRDLKSWVLVGNRATAIAQFRQLEALKIRSDVVYSGMRPSMIQAALKKLKNNEIDCLVSTSVLGEGTNMSVDLMVKNSPDNCPIDFVQHNGRVGRDNVGEVINVAAEHERFWVYAIARRAKQLQEMDYRTGQVPPMRRARKFNPAQAWLF